MGGIVLWVGGNSFMGWGGVGSGGWGGQVPPKLGSNSWLVESGFDFYCRSKRDSD